jgi:imidazolonepropionase-like amidohydrolase
VTAGVDSIEHGHRIDRADLELMKAKGTFLVPTVGGIDGMVERHKNEPMSAEQQKHFDALLQGIQQEIQIAMTLGVRIASGFDAAEAEGQGKNANELVALTKRGLPPIEAIRAATVNAADLMGWQDKVGALEPGHYADVIAIDGDPLADLTVLQHAKFVMKGGVVAKDSLSSAH